MKGKLEIAGREKFDGTIHALQSAGRSPITGFDLPPLLSRDFRTMEREHFDTEGHGTWPELSPPYATWKEVKYPGKPILQGTGALYAALTREGGADEYETGDTFTIKVGGEVGRRGAAHMRPHGNRPARKPIDPTPKDVDRFGDTARKQVRRKVSKLGIDHNGSSD